MCHIQDVQGKESPFPLIIFVCNCVQPEKNAGGINRNNRHNGLYTLRNMYKMDVKY